MEDEGIWRPEGRLAEQAGLRSTFVAPPRPYAPMPALLLNDDLSEEAIAFTLEELASKGVGGVFLHPRAGLEVRYLSDEYWERLRFTLDRCAEFELHAWLCDEFNWPSGPVAGTLLAAHPEYRQRYLDYLTSDARAGSPLRLDVPGETVVARALCGDQLIDLVANIDEGKMVWTPPAAGQVVVLFIDTAAAVMPVGSNAPWTDAEQPGYLDVLNNQAVAAFMERTHQQYDQHLSDYYGTVVKGVYSQGPANYHGWQWTPSLPEVFRERKGYDLLGRLHELVWPVGEHVKTRSDYHEVARDLYVEAFYRPIAEWAEERGLSFGGSLFRESDLAHQPGLHGEVFTPLQTMRVPAVRLDRVNHASAGPYDVATASARLKLVSSVAHAAGSTGALAEIGSGAGWGLTLADLRTGINSSLVMGANLIKLDAVHLSLKGMRKRDFPPSHFVQEPWWRYYLDLVDYTARLCYLLGQGTHVADVALLYPTQSLWLEHALKPAQGSVRSTVAAFQMISGALLRLQWDFDYLFEHSIAAGDVRAEEGRLHVGNESFSVLILPPLMALPLEVLSLAKEMLEGGGTVLALGRLPTASGVSAQDSELLSSIEAIWGPRARRLATGEAQPLPGPKHEAAAERIERIHYHGGRAIYVAWSSPLTADLAETVLSDLLADGPERDLTVESPQRRDFVYVHRRTDEGNAYFVVNQGTRATKATLGLPGAGRIERWDALTGEITPVYVYRSFDGRVQVPQTLAPGEGVILVTSSGDDAPHLDSVDGCEVVGLTETEAEIRVVGKNPRLRVGATEIPVPVEQALPPLKFRHDWQVKWDGPNTWLLEPWNVRIMGEAESGRPPKGPSSLGQPEGLSVRARLTVGALRGAKKLARKISPPSRSIRTTRFIPSDELTRRSVRLLSNLGIDTQGLYAHEILRLVRDLGQETGVGFREAFLPPGASYEATSSFYADFVPPDLTLVYEELGEPLEVAINGVPVADPSHRVDVWDRSNRALALGSRVVPGRNTLTVRGRVPSFPTTMPCIHGLEPIVLRGSFTVKGRHIVSPERHVRTGEWSAMGLPHYSGCVTYTQRFRLPATYLGQDLVLELGDVRETAEVWLNGEIAGYRIWPPYRLPIGHLIREGDNELKIAVTNTAANLLGHPRPSGLLGSVRIVSYPRQTVSLLDGGEGE